MENNDPSASLMELCQISSSQEDCLRRSRFAGEPDDSDSSDEEDESVDIPVETTPIEILSAPESAEEKENDGCSQQDQFHTPPEGLFLASSQGQQSMHHGHVAGDQSMAIDSDCTDISKAVDLGRDTDFGFSEEVELAQKRASVSGGDSSGGVRRAQENEVIHSESNIISISSIRSSLNVGSTDPMKRSVLVTENLGVKTPTGKSVEKVAKSTEKLKSPAQNHQFSDVMLLDTINDGESIHGETSAKKRPKFRAETIRSEIEDVSGNSGFAAEGIVNSRRNEVDSEVERMRSNGERDSSSKNTVDLDGCRSTSPNIAKFPGIQTRAKGKRELPVSIAGGSVWNAQRKNESGISRPKDNPWEYPILYTLRELEKYSNRDTTLEGLSLLEVMNRCGVTFP
ncbi:hypothetical protein HS088_TW15G00324 [Tripterygium wilfordii]|uniref:Uncharacterized protein n=1 Tax=Tripterygium wilfordii TaxID=458696 RepID=A0A7J7CLB3_TRIWF|nr:hypothetical protein HS088_TW15G00324 [Tripterygium wilfordii]